MIDDPHTPRYRPSRRRTDHAATLEHADTFAREREAAKQHECDPPPLGCYAAVGEPCRVIGHLEILLTRQPAHLCRLRKAGLAAPSTIPRPETTS